MRIRKLTASFGKLENEALSFHDGLNVIYAPNESGKSTWCAFIQAMLYGIDSSERARAGYLPDKLRYAPWSGAPMEGTMELNADHCDITITRRTRSKGAPMQEFSAVYTDTNVPVKNLNGANAGQMLTGVSKDVFRRSAFVAQGTVAVKGSPELEKRINAIVSTGEEQCSYSEADERLRAWQRKRRYNRRGLLPELEGRMDETQRKLEEMSGSLQNVDELEDRLAQTRRECADLERQVNLARKDQRRQALERLQRGREAMSQRSAEHDEAVDRLSRQREELQQGPFGLRPPEELEAGIAADLETLRAPAQTAAKALGALWCVLCMVLAMTAAAVYTRVHHVALIIAAVVFCAAALVLLLRYSRLRRQREEQQRQKKQILKKYQLPDADALDAAFARHRQIWAEMRETDARERQHRADFEQAREEYAALEEKALQQLDFTDGSSPAAQYGRQLMIKRGEAEKLSRQIAAVTGRLAAMGDPLVLASDLGSMRAEYEQICDEYDAITLAVEQLRDADEEMQSRFSPELGRLASSYMSAVTGGRYADVLINRDFTAMTRTDGDAVARDAEYLSAGTADIMYLAVRLAVCELALPDGEPCPLIIDDALVNLDETRLEQAMKLLGEIARERQVILFTCREP